MATDQLVIAINGNIKAYEKSLKKIGDETKALEDKLSSIAKKSAVAFVGLAAAVVGSIAAFRKQEQAEIRTRQTIKATGQAAGITAEEIFKMASALQEMTTFGDEAIIEGQNLLLTFKNIGKDTFPRATEAMLDMATAMKIDLRSASIQVGKALNDPTTGLSMLTRVGITFTEQQKSQIKSMQKFGDLAGAQAIILKELESQFGGTSKAAAQGTGVFIQLGNIVGDLVEDVGRELTPALVVVAGHLKTFFLALRENKELVKTAAGVLGIATVIAGLITVVATAGVIFLKLRAVMIASTLAMKAMTFSVKGLLGAAGIGLLIIIVTDLALNWEKRFAQMQAIFFAFSKNITNVGKGLATFFKGVFTLDVAAIKEGFAQVKGAVVESFEEIANDPAFSDPEKDPINKFFPTPEKVQEKADESTDAIMQAKRDQVDAIIEQDEELKAMLDELSAEDRERKKEELASQIKSEQELRDEGINERFKIQQESNKKFLDDQKKFGKAFATINQFMNSEVFKGTKQAFGNLEELTQSKNKTLKGIGKTAAIANVIIKTSESAMAIFAGFSTIPIIGPALGIAGAAAAIAFGAEKVAGIKKAQKGMLVQGGIPGVDSVPILAQQNELISPAQNFEEVIGSVRAKREAEALGGDEGGGSVGGGQVAVMVSFDSAEASKVITVAQVEDTNLGISRDSFKEAS